MMKVNIQHRCSLLLCRLQTTCSPLDSACSFLMTRLTGELGDGHVSKSAAEERCILEQGKKKKKLHDYVPLQVEFFC